MSSQENTKTSNRPHAGFHLSGRVAIVTGAAGDIGRSTVQQLVACGAQVVAEDIKPEVDALADGDRIVTLVGDVSDEATARRAVELAEDTFGSLDVLVNNAGRTLNKPTLETSVADWDTLMAVNARGSFLHAREALRLMAPRGRGVVVNVASVASVVALPETVAYAASKGAVAQLTRSLAAEFGKRGIRVNAVAPGVVETGILDGIIEDSRATLASYGDAQPMGRVGQPGEIADTIVWLASDQSSFVTGAMLLADGGYSIV